MQLYYHPASTTSRMVMLFAAEQKIPLEMKVIDKVSAGKRTELRQTSTRPPNGLASQLIGDRRATTPSISRSD